MLAYTIYLSFAGALVLALLPRAAAKFARIFALLVAVAGLAVALAGFASAGAQGPVQVANLAWVPSMGIHYTLAADGISRVLVLLTGLASVADKRAGGFSLGMGQRLGIAAALLADPEALILDEPVNGLDIEGVRWVRHLLKDLAREGRTILVSSHLMSEMAQTADHLIVIGRGRIIADAGTDEFINRHTAPSIRVDGDDADAATLTLE